jgi:hypothetical protein
VDIGVVGTLDGGIELADAIVDHDIVDGGAQLQQAAALLTIGLLQTVVDDGADVLALGIIADGFLLDDGGHGNDLLQVVGRILDVLQHLLADLVFEHGQHSIYCEHRRLVLVEGVGGGKQEALHAVDAAQRVGGQEGVVLEIKVRAGVLQLSLGGHALLRQQVDDLPDGVALGDGDLHQSLRIHGILLPVVHVHNEGAEIHVAVELIGARLHVAAVMQEAAGQLEKSLGIHQSRILQLFGHIGHAIALVHGDLHLHRGLVQGAQVVDHQPADTCQQARAQHHAHQIDGGAGAAAGTAALFIAAALLLGGLLTTDLTGVPHGRLVLSVASVIIRHRKISFPAGQPMRSATHAITSR